jgi:hypothetical protein
MRGETIERFGRLSMRAALLAAALALAGCGSSSSSGLFKSSPLDIFSTSSKATTGTGDAAADAAAGDANAPTDIDCPGVTVRTGASTLMIGNKQPGEDEPSALELRYQGSIVRTARECRVNAGVMTMKVGVEGRVITGPVGGPGEVDVPLRLAVVQEGVAPKVIVSKLAHIPVTVSAAVDRVAFTHIDPDISFPLPIPRSALDAYIVYVGFDTVGAQPEKKKPAVKGKPVTKKKPAATPAS